MVNAGAGHGFPENRVSQREETAQGPERFGQRHTELRHPLGQRVHELLRTEDRPQRVFTRALIEALVDQLPQWLGVPVLGERGQSVEEAIRQPRALSGVHVQVLGAHSHEIVAVLLHAEEDHAHPLHVLRHAVQVFHGLAGIPGDVDDAVAQVGVARHDVVNDSRDAALQVRICGFHDDGHVHILVVLLCLFLRGHKIAGRVGGAVFTVGTNKGVHEEAPLERVGGPGRTPGGAASPCCLK